MQRKVQRMAASLTRERRAGHALLVLCLAAYAFIVPRGPQHNPDSRLALTYALVERGTLQIDGYVHDTADRAVRNERLYSDKAPGLSLWLVPLYSAVRLIPLPDVALPAADRFLTRYLLTFLGIGIPHAAFVVWLFHWLRRHNPSIGPRAAVSVGYALGSPAYAYSVHAFGHVPAAMCLFAGAAALELRGRKGALAGGALLACAVTFEYPAALPALLLAVLHLRCQASRQAEWAPRARLMVTGALPALVVLGVYHSLAFGAPWLTGYSFVDPSGPFAAVHDTGWMGVGLPHPRVALELLLGARRGLFVVTPWLLLAVPGAYLLWRSRRQDVFNTAAAFLPLLVVNAGYAVWDGGASWGPRHLTAALPFVAVLALPAVARWRAISFGLIGLSAIATCTAVATATLPPSGDRALGDFLIPALNAGAAGNTLGASFGLAGWRGLVLLAGIALACWVWGSGLRRSWGVVFVCALALVTATRIDTSYAEYAEGYYLYLGSRIAAGEPLYRTVQSTQAPVVPLLAAALWRFFPDVYAPRLAAVVCNFVGALLAGRLAARLTRKPSSAAPAAVLAALLPLGAGSPATFDANTILTPLAPALALLLIGPARRWQAAAAALVAVAGIAAKLTFVPLVFAPLVMAPRLTWRAAALTLGGQIAAALMLVVWSGPAALDALTGELEGPYLPAGAVLAALQLVRFEGLALVFAGLALWRLRGDVTLRPAHALTLAASLMPLLALHQGTFVSVARPAEPVIAAYAVAGIHLIVDRLPRLRFGAFAALLALAAALPMAALVESSPPSARPRDTPMDWIRSYELFGEALVAPPFFAARAGKLMPFDYADWTVLGMRAVRGVEPERTYASALVGDLARGAFPFVVADFRLTYIPGAAAALQSGYTPAGRDGEGALEVTLWLPRRETIPER